jgi:hypothetical protein
MVVLSVCAHIARAAENAFELHYGENPVASRQ